MSVTEGDVILKLSVVRDQAVLSLATLAAQYGHRLLPSEMEEVRSVLSRLALDCRRIGEWGLANRITERPPPPDANPDEEDTEPSFRKR